MSTYTVHPPITAGTYAQQFGWTVTTPIGWTAYSGSQSEARVYARSMNERLAGEAQR